MTRPNPILFALYRDALRLYPLRMRRLYQEQMLQTVRDADVERSYSALCFWLYLFADLFRSSAKERLLMIRQQILARPLFFYTLALALIFTLWGFSAAITFQQLLRRGANQPQIQMAQNYAAGFGSGSLHPDSIPAAHIDLASSLEPFVILYNADGNPVRTTGYLNDAAPTPPPGVLAYLHTHSTDNFTWQPRRGIRIAAVAQRIDGLHPGFILVGRSLTLVQQQEDLLRRGTFITWFLLMALLIAGAMLLNRLQNTGAKLIRNSADTSHRNATPWHPTNN